MSEKQTKKFVDKWNEKNNFPVGINTPLGNMRYVSPGVITWNEYDAPEVNIVEFVDIFNTI